MILYQWAGLEGDTSPFSVVQTGTGQSGTIAETTNAGQILTHEKALKFTQQTSSGAGSVTGAVTYPRPIGYDKYRLNWVYRLKSNDADWTSVAFKITDFDGTDGEEYELRIYSNAGATEEIQYLTTGDAFVDTGFTWVEDQGIGNRQWVNVGFDINTTDKKYTRQFCGSEFTLSSLDNYSPGSYPAENALAIAIEFVGVDTLCTFHLDSMTIEVVE